MDDTSSKKPSPDKETGSSSGSDCAAPEFGASLMDKVRAKRAELNRDGKIVKYLSRKQHVRDGSITRWLCFPGEEAEQGLEHGALVMSPKLYVDDTTRVPHRWKELPQIEKPYAWLNALIEAGPASPFTLNLSEQVVAQGLRDTSGFLNYVRRRIQLYLREAFRQAPEFWCAVDAHPEKGNRLHLHGSIGINSNQKDLVELALRKAAGAVPADFRRHVVHIGETHTWPPGWPAYCLKHHRTTSTLIRGQLVTATQPLNRRAKNLYVERRVAFLRSKRRN